MVHKENTVHNCFVHPNPFCHTPQVHLYFLFLTVIFSILTFLSKTKRNPNKMKSLFIPQRHCVHHHQCVHHNSTSPTVSCSKSLLLDLHHRRCVHHHHHRHQNHHHRHRNHHSSPSLGSSPFNISGSIIITIQTKQTAK